MKRYLDDPNKPKFKCVIYCNNVDKSTQELLETISKECNIEISDKIDIDSTEIKTTDQELQAVKSEKALFLYPSYDYSHISDDLFQSIHEFLVIILYYLLQIKILSY